MLKMSPTFKTKKMEKRKYSSKSFVPGQNKKKIEIEVDNNTDSELSVYVTEKKNYQKEPFVMFFQQINLFLAKTLTATACRVLFYFLAQVKYNNEVDLDISDMARDLKYSSRQLLRGINQLLDLGLVTVRKSAKDKRRNIYIINPSQSWKGRDDKRHLVDTQFFPDNQLKLRFPDEKGRFPEAKVLKLKPNENFDIDK